MVVHFGVSWLGDGKSDSRDKTFRNLSNAVLSKWVCIRRGTLSAASVLLTKTWQKEEIRTSSG